MEKQKLFKVTCIRDCFDGGAFDRQRLADAGINFKEEKGELCRSYIHGQARDGQNPLMIDPHNPIAVHFQFEEDPQVLHEGFHFDREKMQYIRDKPAPTQAQLDKLLEEAKAERRTNETLQTQLELVNLRDENEKLRRELEAKKNPPAAGAEIASA